MKNTNEWFDSIKKQIELLKSSLSERDYKKYKLHLLLCVAERVTQFSHECSQCQIFLQDIYALSQDVGNLVQVADKERQQGYFKSMGKITNHLKDQHKLVDEGYYVGMWMGLGIALGLPIGIPLGNIAWGLPIGLAIGVAIGTSLDAKAKREGRIICPKETATTKNFRILAIILGLLILVGLAAFLVFR